MNVLEVGYHPGKPVCESTEGVQLKEKHHLDPGSTEGVQLKVKQLLLGRLSDLDNSYHIGDGIAHGDCWARFNGARLDYHNKYGMPLPEERADLYIT